MKKIFKNLILKCKDMLSISSNKPLFKYRVHHYLKKNVGKNSARKLAEKNKEFYKEKKVDVLWFETYDGSSQLCHPDIVFWDNGYWMIATPYPYGLEEYENPSLYHGTSLNGLIPVDINPIAYPALRGYGSHLSDPCLFLYNDLLYCFYRDTLNYGSVIENRIIFKRLTKEKVFSEGKIVMSSSEDGLLSPSVILYEGVIYLYYVSYVKGLLVLKGITLSEVGEKHSDFVVEVCNQEPDWDVWHIDFKVTRNSFIEGLFLMRGRNEPGKFKLKKARLEVEKQRVYLLEDVVIDSSMSEVMAFPYKSCIIPEMSGKALLSFRDINSVYVLKIIDI